MPNFAARRGALAARSGGEPVVVASGPITYRSRDTQRRFRPESDFWYLTGFSDPDSIAVVKGDRFVIFAPPRDPAREVWDGERAGLEGVGSCGAEARPLADLERGLAAELAGARRIHVARGTDRNLDHELAEFLRASRTKPAPDVADPAAILAGLRAIKDDEEIARIEEAAAISLRAHESARNAARPGMREYEIEAELLHGFRKAGAFGPAYPPIVASGVNATTLHYTKNEGTIGDRDLVLVDAGAESSLYAADVTRTWAVSGRPTAEQEAVLAAVAEAQRAGIAACRPGATLEEVETIAHRILIRALLDWKAISGAETDILAGGHQKPYTLHRTSHFLGLDVHDPAPEPEAGATSPVLRPGMVVTVEPGLYFRPGTTAPNGFSGIGVRIEDDVLITGTGHRVLSA